jgi:hypothetical protein
VSKSGRFPGYFRGRSIFFRNINRGVFRGFLGIENRPVRQGLVFPKKTSFYSRVFADGQFRNHHLVARHLMAGH